MQSTQDLGAARKQKIRGNISDLLWRKVRLRRFTFNMRSTSIFLIHVSPLNFHLNSGRRHHRGHRVFEGRVGEIIPRFEFLRRIFHGSEIRKTRMEPSSHVRQILEGKRRLESN